jgi:hypothetical protein
MLAVLEDNLSLAAQVFSDVVGLLDRGIIRPVHPVVPMPFSKMEEAFRLMQTSQHLGKIVLEPAEDELVPVRLHLLFSSLAYRREMLTTASITQCIPPKVTPYAFDPHSTYILAGGSGGLGRCLGRWMVEQGARHIVFLSRSGLKKPELQETVNMLQRRGARVAAYPCDLSKEADVVAAVAILANEFPPVKGVIQGAMVLNVREQRLYCLPRRLIDLVGRNLPKHDASTVHGRCSTKSPGKLEFAQISAAGHGLLRAAVLQCWHCRFERTRELFCW